ncbi:RagB/SusD family nutrient uptake outer membrane protein [bacterium]|nr:RagB/SusD family nutrient uptake outer membrane protein [bacterium]
MKKLITPALALTVAAGIFTGCSSDYLETAPVTEVSAAVVQTTQEGAQAALNGLCYSMYYQESDLFDYLFMNGEPYVQTVWGEIFGQDYYSYMWSNQTGSNYKWQANANANGWMTMIPWSYCYNLINQANTILKGIDDINGDREVLDFIKAQALSIRAHAYTRLLQIYSYRWERTDNGNKYCVVLRTEPGTDAAPLATMNEVLSQIYSDLDTAVEIFKNSTATRTYNWEPDLSVAQGLYARAALLKDDWQTAQQMAHDARQAYPVMSAEEYKAGFNSPTKEWIWSGYNGGETWFTTWGMMFCCNGAYPGVWGLGAGSINYELYRQFPDGDIRADLFFTPDKIIGNRPAKSSFWNQSYCDPASMNLMKNQVMKAQIHAFEDNSYPTDKSVNWPKPYNNFQTGNDDESYVVFGAQFKFWSRDDYGSGYYCYMRGSEMLLIEAEAACHNNQPNVAIANLKELNAQRNPNYTCNLSGDALLDEVKLQRRFELWGEGFNWFDLKRWNMPMIRKPWIEKDVDSNNIPQADALEKQPDDRGWKFAVPTNESRYNPLVDRTLVDD